MEQEHIKIPTKRYPFRFSTTMIAVFIVGLVLCAACFSLATWQFSTFIKGDISSPYEWVKYFLLYFVSIFLAVLLIAMLIRSEYVITENKLVIRFGIIRSKYDIKKIRSVSLVDGGKKLNVYFDDFKTKYMAIVVKKAWYDDFIATLTSRNEHIEFDFASTEGKDKKKK